MNKTELVGRYFPSGIYRDTESPVHLKAAFARSASKKRRQSVGDSGRESPVRPEDNEELERSNGKKTQVNESFRLFQRIRNCL